VASRSHESLAWLPGAERPFEQIRDRPGGVVLQDASARTREMRVGDARQVVAAPFLPPGVRPRAPLVLRLIEHVQWLVAELGELGAPAGAALDVPIRKDGAHHEDLLPVVDLVPDALEHLAEGGGVAVAPIHEPRHIREAHVAGIQFLVVEDAHAPAAHEGVAVEPEVDLLDTPTLGGGAKLRLRALGAAAEQDVVAPLHAVAPHR